MKHLFLILFFVNYSISSFSQNTYKRNENETVESFVSRCFPEIKDNLTHPIIEGNWGDTTHKHKIVVFYKVNDSEEHGSKAIILELMHNNTYKRLKFDHNFGIGVYVNTSAIVSVFFYDTDGDKLKELIVVENGIYRCPVLLEEYNEETKKMESYSTSASCELCGYQAFGQKINSDVIEDLDGAESNEDETWGNKCDAKTVKELLQDKKKIKK